MKTQRMRAITKMAKPWKMNFIAMTIKDSVSAVVTTQKASLLSRSVIEMSKAAATKLATCLMPRVVASKMRTWHNVCKSAPICFHKPTNTPGLTKMVSKLKASSIKTAFSWLRQVLEELVNVIKQVT